MLAVLGGAAIVAVVGAVIAVLRRRRRLALSQLAAAGRRVRCAIEFIRPIPMVTTYGLASLFVGDDALIVTVVGVPMVFLRSDRPTVELDTSRQRRPGVSISGSLTTLIVRTFDPKSVERPLVIAGWLDLAVETA